MAILVPQPGDDLSASLFGIPVANQLNNMQRAGGTWRRVASQAIPQAAWTTISWDTELADTNNYLAMPGTTATIPAGQDGVYTVTLVAYIGLTAALQAIITGITDNLTAAADPITGAASLSWCGPLVAGNTISGRAYQNASASVNLVGRMDLWKMGL